MYNKKVLIMRVSPHVRHEMKKPKVTHLEVRRGGPGTSPLAVENGSLVDIAGTDQAVWKENRVRLEIRCLRLG